MKKNRLNSREVASLLSLQSRLCELSSKLSSFDLPLNYGNGSVCEQLSCASAALECILQEY